MNPAVFYATSQLTANAANEAGGKAYAMDDRHALAQLCMTGCFNDTYYGTAEDQTDKVLALAKKVPVDFLAKLAVYARAEGKMKDAPAVLLGVLLTRDAPLFMKAFGRVVDSPKMLRNFIQVIRSGVTGRKSLGTVAKRTVQEYLRSHTPRALFRGSIGQEPSLKDVLALAHPTPENVQRDHFYRYVFGREHAIVHLPVEVQEYEAFKKDPRGSPPDVPFLLLTNLPLSTEQWVEVALRMSWQQLRQNLNALSRQGVFKDAGVVKTLAAKLAVPSADVMPYQCFSAYLATSQNSEIPLDITNALQDSAEKALDNIPTIDGEVVVAVDVSGSMSSALTGERKGATSAVRCIDAAAVLAAAIQRKNPKARVMPFDTTVREGRFNPRDSLMTNAALLAGIKGGGTDCGIVFEAMTALRRTADLVIMISDNESWFRNASQWAYGQRPAAGRTQIEWSRFKRQCPQARLVCIDLQPNTTLQVLDGDKGSVLNVGGFSDRVFDVVSLFAQNKLTGSHWVDIIDRINI